MEFPNERYGNAYWQQNEKEKCKACIFWCIISVFELLTVNSCRINSHRAWGWVKYDNFHFKMNYFFKAHKICFTFRLLFNSKTHVQTLVWPHSCDSLYYEDTLIPPASEWLLFSMCLHVQYVQYVSVLLWIFLGCVPHVWDHTLPSGRLKWRAFLRPCVFSHSVSTCKHLHFIF